VDFNQWQATGRSRDVLRIEPLEEKFRSFGWEVRRLDGHDHAAIRSGLDFFVSGEGTAPLVLVADTIKGKGVSFMEDDNNWHYRIPNASEWERAKSELMGGCHA
jgi:transketolase